MPPNALLPRGPLSNTASDFAAVKSQWRNPSDIPSILTIIGGDIIHGALAQLVSSHPRPFTPVAFSFGWVAYSFSAILAAIGSRRLAPQPDFSCTLIDVSTGYPRDINSWALSRLVRDYEVPSVNTGGLTVAFFRTSRTKQTGVPDRDWVYYTGAFVILLQLGIAVIPGALFGNWNILIVTFGGTLLAQVQAALPQWRKELWAARPVPHDKHEVVCLTKGNGSPYVLVVTSDRCGLRLTDLASGREVHSVTTVPMIFLLAVLWLVHLFTVQGIKSDSWYLLAVGAVGMLQNAIASGARRTPGALGFHLDPEEEIHDKKVFVALQKAEEKEKKVGLALVDTFFPGGLRPSEEKWRQDIKARYAAEKMHRDAVASNQEISTEKGALLIGNI
ncbi:hypothetical protein D9615_006933 [Tricholomella constricta]|uniref:Uncharacterized protein n=1 Tax=Tricholomella constricta TaxID=117010 RepID=A0A8H5H975_9AGAR|nr:hypothetical protein D9615_006933 [Tricholomella constricta]